MANTLREKGITCDDAFEDPEVKDFISKYMLEEIDNEHREFERLAKNINIRLAHMVIAAEPKDKIYPIINEYIGHHISKTHYFYKEGKEVKIGTIDVVPSTIILPNDIR